MKTKITAKNTKIKLKTFASKEKATILQRFFKTKPGQYGEGDIFLGVSVPHTRKIAKEFRTLSLKEISTLLQSPIHEERLCALLILVDQFEKGDTKQQTQVYQYYCKQTKHINNWDLVDLSAYKIVGRHLLNKERTQLYHFAKSDDLWKKRIAIIATYAFIKNDDFRDTFALAKILLLDKHDLMHKAVGWMLREVGKRNLKSEETFLKNTYKKMPRTMLRYAIEKFQEEKRQDYLKGRI